MRLRNGKGKAYTNNRNMRERNVFNEGKERLRKGKSMSKVRLQVLKGEAARNDVTPCFLS